MTDGPSALARMSDDAGTPAGVALLLVDGQMPVMDGFTLVEQMRLQPALAGMPVIMLTSAGQAADPERCRQLGVDRYLLKPVRSADLRDAILEILSGARGSVPATEAAIASTAPAPRRRLKILVADDVVVNQKLLQRMLEKLGHVVMVVANGREAADLASTESFDLVFMDVQMPVMDGLESTAAIRQRERLSGSHLPIVAVTAHAMQGDKERFLNAGMDGYVSKPLGQAEVLEAIAGALRATTSAA
jgi:two-component system, sensor histidine kinase and response regulator